MEDKRLCCQDCGNYFIYTIKQQISYAKQGWKAPIRCPSCRTRKKIRWQINEGISGLMSGGPRRLYSRHGRGIFKRLGK